jgi:hypothetical protein
MTDNNVTFVTSYFKIYENDYDIEKIFEKRLELFLKLAVTGINICIFTTPEFQYTFTEIHNKYNNIKLIDIYSKNDLKFSKKYFSEIENCQLPEKRSHVKDTEYYMSLMNSKIDFVNETIKINPFSSKYFCWFDFSLPYIFKNLDKTIEKFKLISQRKYTDSFLTMPGCWNFKVNDVNFIKTNICWRFCGGFFIGDKNSLVDFYNLSFNNYSEFLTLTKSILWEVNYWAWLESYKNFKPIHYLADHNDTIIDIPSHLYTMKIGNFANEITIYNYPKIDSDDIFFPSSSSYIYDNINKKHIINTRYVNYYYKDNWECDFFNHARQIKTINVKSELDSSFQATSFNIVGIDETGLVNNYTAFSVGLEDIRLYSQNGNIKFIASNVNYIPNLKNRMIIGDYNNNVCSNCRIINMIWDSKCEKNWSPIQFNNSEKQLFIYKWSPYQLGFVDEENNLQICLEKQFNDNIINKFRGSTPFIEKDENTLIGLVHYSVPNVPPIYYHSLILIDKNTLLPIMYSDPFKFYERSIEFCIGFTIYEDKYLFWISQMDREPLLLKININKIPIINKL